MSYVDAGYTIALIALTLYGASLVLRRRRLARAAANAARDARVVASPAPTVPATQPVPSSERPRTR
ncbi:MAG: hypothetical protein ACRDWE_03075 [Acidimicrobiales bacterium]